MKVIIKRVECEEVKDSKWNHVGIRRTCFMDDTTTIEAPGISISTTRDEAMGAMGFIANKNISYLPVMAYVNFPNLEIISAYQCSIVEITKENFAKLSFLRALWLGENKISEIKTDTFEDLTSLVVLSLSINKLF